MSLGPAAKRSDSTIPAAPTIKMNLMTDAAPDKLDLIAVGAHPDDVEIACGGTLAAGPTEDGWRVTLHLPLQPSPSAP